MDVLGDPDRILEEARRLNDSQGSTARLLEVLEALREIETKQRRLVRLFTEGDLPESLLEGERTELSKKRAALEDERRQLEVLGRPSIDLVSIQRLMPRVLDQIRRWVSASEGDDLSLMLRALDIQMIASPIRVRIKGAVPAYAGSVESDLATIERTSA
jgi:hypothetical protein